MADNRSQSAVKFLVLVLLLVPMLQAQTPQPKGPDPEAAALITSALTSIDAKDLDGAAAQLAKAQTLSPDQEFYWATYGKLMLRRSRTAEAVSAYQKELALHPAETPIYRSIVDAQFMLHQRTEVEQTLRAWSIAEPANLQPAMKLVMLLAEDGDAAAALREGKAALARMPEEIRGRHDLDDDRLQVELARAQILGGDKTAGAAAVSAVLKRSKDPVTIDNAAWVLADAGVDLPLAQTASQAVLVLYGVETTTWALGHPMKPIRTESLSVASAWETLGWIYFRQGKLDQAKSYMNAAWLALQSPEAVEHLAEIEAAMGNKAAAVADYELAAAIPQPDDNMVQRKAIAPRTVDVKLRAQALLGAEAQPAMIDPPQQLQVLHTVDLGKHDGRNQTVMYQLLLKDGHVIDALPARSDRMIEGALDMLGKADFSQFFPAASHMQLIRSGQVTCRSGNCQIVVGQ
jgi:tetratricopeptide (TPR) repeat protein